MATCDPLWTLVDTFRRQWSSEHVQQCNASRDAGYQTCAQQEDQGQNTCTQTADQGYNSCTQTADEGYNSCTQQADEGYNACCTWAPCSWFCDAWVWVSNVVCATWTWVSNVVCVAWTWVSNIVCVVWTWISDWVCVAWTWVSWAGCRVGTWLVNGIILIVEGIGTLLCPIYTMLLPTWRICATMMQTVSATPRLSATAFNFATVPSRFSYRDSGQRYEFSIDTAGTIVFRPDENTAWQPVAAQSISFDTKRLGVRSPAPQFDMVAANCGRVIGKEKGTERLFFALLDPMFWQFGDPANPDADIDAPAAVARASELVVPSTYFKLDPEENQPGALVVDLLVAVTDPAGRMPPFNGHPAAERFDLFRTVLGSKGGLLGQFFHGMIVSAEPRLWHLIDARPQKGAGRVPAGIPEFPQVGYCQGSSNTNPAVQCSIAFDRVLDIGAGHAHWHEQYDTTYGGEIQALLSSGVSNVPLLTYYQLFNGPVVDRDGFIDGTCNYYLMCRLATAGGAATAGGCVPLPPDEDTAPTVAQGFALLFLDEQSLFSQRWRLTHPDDYEGLMFALLPDLHKRPNQWGYDVTRFWCPFRAGNVNAQSRMAVSRQTIMVSGVDATSGQQELYSINFSWATSDFTWRWRAFPDPLIPEFLAADDLALGTETVDTSRANLVYPQTIRLREDMTCHVKGTKRLQQRKPEAIIAGRWFQKYLPADCMPIPAASTLTSPPAGKPALKPATGYMHEWQFLPEEVFRRADQFSHFGVYETVNSRSQYYLVELDEKELSAAPPEARWEDRSHQLQIKRAKLDWAVLSGGGPNALNQIATAFPSGPTSLEALVWTLPTQTQNFQSFYSPSRILLRLENRAPIGWIATHWDKRDDDLDVFDGIPVSVTLAHRNPGHKPHRPLHVTVKFTKHVIVLNVPQVLQAVLTLVFQAGALVKGVVSFQSIVAQKALASGGGTLSADDLNKVWENIWAVKIGSLPAPGAALVLFERNAATAFTFRAGSDGWFDADWVPADAAEASAMQLYGTSHARDEFGTSIWFVDAVGHASTAQQTRFETGS